MIRWLDIIYVVTKSFLLFIGLINHSLQRIHILSIATLSLHHHNNLLYLLTKLWRKTKFLSSSQQILLLLYLIIQILQLGSPFRNDVFWIFFSFLLLWEQICRICWFFCLGIERFFGFEVYDQRIWIWIGSWWIIYEKLINILNSDASIHFFLDLWSNR